MLLASLAAMSKALALSVAFLLFACGDDDGGRSDPDGGNQPDPETGTPILERTSLAPTRARSPSSRTRWRATRSGRRSRWSTARPLVARASFGPIGGDDYGSILAVMPASFAPVGLGDEAYRTTALEPLRFPAMAASGDGAAIAWVAGDQSDRVVARGSTAPATSSGRRPRSPGRTRRSPGWR